MLLLGQPVKRFFLQPRMRFSHGFLFLLGIYFASTECPRNLVNDVPQAETNGPPGMEPEEHFIQTTFIYRDLSDDDQSYSRSVMDKLSSIRLRLKLQARVTIDNENVDCTDNGFSQCREYPLNKPYHFLVVEDSSHGAAVYSVDKKYNVGKPGVIEMSLLDALSRHSLQPLVTYASEEAEHQVGFVRELSAGEIDGFLQENAVLEKKKKSSIFIRSPLELNLIDQRILDLRLPNLETSLGKLQEFTETKLPEVLDSGKLVFVIFWSNVNSVSMHAFHLWAKASEMIDVDNDVILGFVPCHLQTDVCTAFGISHQDHHTVFAYRNGKKITTQVNLRDEEFYVEWIKMIKNHDPVNRLDSKEEFDQARKGIVKGFPNVRQAVTIGTFNSEESKEFQSFQKVANILNGRYHFLYRIVDSVSPSISTYRPIEKNKRTEYNGRFDVKSLLDHVTHSSVPSILDISNGFTSDIVYRNPNSLLLLIHNNHGKLVEELMVLANQPEFIKSHLLAQLDISNSLPTQTLFSKMKLEANHLPATCLFLKSEIQCFTTVDGITNILNDRIAKKPDHIIEINSKTAHPLKWIQLEHINKIFGHQDITLLPEPVAIKNIQNPHNFDGMDLGSISGCPMMAHLNNHLKDEL